MGPILGGAWAGPSSNTGCFEGRKEGTTPTSGRHSIFRVEDNPEVECVTPYDENGTTGCLPPHHSFDSFQPTNQTTTFHTTTTTTNHIQPHSTTFNDDVFFSTIRNHPGVRHDDVDDNDTSGGVCPSHHPDTTTRMDEYCQITILFFFFTSSTSSFHGHGATRNTN